MTYHKCSQCGELVPEGATFCQTCGSPTAQIAIVKSGRNCKRCGNKMAWYHKKCRSCGQYMGNSIPLTVIIIAVAVIVAIGYSAANYKLKANEEKSKNAVKVVSYEFKTISNTKAVIIEYEWTNATDKTTSFSWEYVDQVFQNGIECTDTYLLNNQTSASTDVQPGKTYKFKKAYKLYNESSDVEVTIHRLMHKGENILEYTIHMGD